MTNHWVDIKNADLVLIMGGNAAEAHLCGFKWALEARTQRKAKLMVVDPRFTRSASVADFYAPIRTGTDIAFLGGVINHLLSTDRINHEYVKNYTGFTFLVKDEFTFTDGLYSGYDAEKRKYDRSSWGYQIGADGFVLTDPSLQNRRCVYQLLKACALTAETAAVDKVMTIMYALGWTQHSHGSQIIRTGAMVQLLLGNIGMAGGGMNALPGDGEQDMASYVAKRAFKPLRPGQLSYWQNYGKFFVSLMKSWYGDAARPENNYAYDYLPKLDKPYDIVSTNTCPMSRPRPALTATATSSSSANPNTSRSIPWPMIWPRWPWICAWTRKSTRKQQSISCCCTLPSRIEHAGSLPSGRTGPPLQRQISGASVGQSLLQQPRVL